MSCEDAEGMVYEEVKRRITRRINDNAKAFIKLGVKQFYVCGGALLPEEPNDYDLFPIDEDDFNEKWWRTLLNKDFMTWETPNATSFKIDGVKIQLCKFWNDSLINTVERFDFTHCKLGAEFHRAEYKGKKVDRFECTDVYVSDDFIRFRILGYSEYTGAHENDYPLSSLLRVFKYYKRGYIRSSYDVIFQILESFLERGYENPLDFGQQLAGIDIGQEESEGITDNMKTLMHIFFLLTGDVIEDSDIMWGTTTKFSIGDKVPTTYLPGDGQCTE